MSLLNSISHKLTYGIRLKVTAVLLLAACIYSLSLMFTFARKTQPFFPSGAMAEQILEYTAASNFVHRGFLQNWLLVDYSSSPNDEDHPFLYTHQPSGPAVILGLMLKGGMSLLETRMAFAVISLLGALFLFLLVFQTTRIPELALFCFLIYVLDYDGTIVYSDHYVHAFAGINFFGSIYFYLRSLTNPSWLPRAGFIFCLVVGFMTNHITCIPTFVAIMMLHFLLHKSDPVSRRLAWNTFATAAICAALLFGRNIAVFGPEVAFKDFLYTLSNRITAWPSKDSMMQFFEANRIVLWGVGKLETGGFKSWLSRAFTNPINDLSFAIFIAAACAWALSLDVKALAKRVAIILVAFASIYSWHLIFFAQGAIYEFPPYFRMFKIAMIAAVGMAVWQILAMVLERHRTATEDRRPGYLLALVTLLLAAIIVFQQGGKGIQKQMAKYRSLKKEAFESSMLNSYVALKDKMPAGTVLTNIDGLVLNFFVPNLVFGGCDRKAIENSEMARCPSSFVSSETRSKAVGDLIFLSRQFVPGYQTCIGDCYADLVKSLRDSHEIVAEHGLDWVVFRSKKSSPLSHEASIGRAQ